MRRICTNTVVATDTVRAHNTMDPARHAPVLGGAALVSGGRNCLSSGGQPGASPILQCSCWGVGSTMRACAGVAASRSRQPQPPITNHRRNSSLSISASSMVLRPSTRHKSTGLLFKGSSTTANVFRAASGEQRPTACERLS